MFLETRAYDGGVSNARHEAFVEDPHEMRMGSPQYGRLIVDGEEFIANEPAAVESDLLVWSDDGRLLAVQELDYSISYPGTRVVVIDPDRRVQVGASLERKGLSNPIRFDGETLVYRHWQYGLGEEELRLELGNS
jgi:hypothetical protein